MKLDSPRSRGKGCPLRLAYAVTRPERGFWRLDRRGVRTEYGLPPAPPHSPVDDYYAAALRERVRRGMADVLSHHPADF